MPYHSTTGGTTPTESKGKDMTYEAFKAEYAALLARMLSYSIGQAGSNIYASKMADLVDAYPEYEARYDEETA
jgi:hypothetical protein